MKDTNKIIAEFMGAEKTHIQSVGDIYCPVPSKNGSEYADKLQYHKSWDWLMTVIEKILDITFSDDETEISNSEYFYDIRDCVPNINHTYRSIVEFIKWYNKQKI